MKDFDKHWPEVKEKLKGVSFEQKKQFIERLNSRDPAVSTKALEDIKKLPAPKKAGK